MYETANNRTFKIDDDGQRILLANFVARITKETRYVDGRNTETFLTIEGQTGEPPNDSMLPPTTIKADTFPGMTWVMSSWGVRCVLQPGGSTKDDMRTAIQLASNPEVSTIYKHMGWTTIDGQPTYLHAGGGITREGNDPAVTVHLPTELANYHLTETTTSLKSALQATLNLVNVGPPHITWPLLAATVAPLHGPIDFAIHLTGKTGTYKSELMSLFQSHYGSKMDARHLPGSWSSTPNAIEAQAYLTANAPYVLDDFVPSGTSWQIRAYQTTADKIIRAQGNQAGRARLTDVSNLQTTMYPRGIILSTGEDTPEGQSVRARMLILELSPGDITTKALTKAQADRKLYPTTIAAYIQYLAAHPVAVDALAAAERDARLTLGHARTPSMIGRLIASITLFLEWCRYEKTPGIDHMELNAMKAIEEAATTQSHHIESADPLDIFCQTIRTIFASGLGHVRTTTGGIPRNPTTLGWTAEGDGGDMPSYRSHGPCLGWVSWRQGELYVDVNSGYALVRKIARDDITLSRNTLMKRMKDGGLLTRVDASRQRNTIRITAENHPRQVLALNLQTALDTQEDAQDSTELL